MRYLVAILLVVVIILGGCSTSPTTNTPTVDYTGELKTFNDFDQVKNFIANSTQPTRNSPGIARMELTASVSNLAEDSFGSTNTQYQNVDEADIIKNDDRYLYLLQGNEIVIIDSETNEIVSTTSLDDENVQPQDIFLFEDSIIVIAQKQKEVVTVQQYDIMPQMRFEQETVAFVYDVTNRTQPQLSSTTSASGNYKQARLTDGTMYLITQQYPWYGDIIIEPRVISGSRMIPTDFHYFPQPSDDHNYNTIVSFDVESEEVISSETYILGTASTLMMSENALYIAYENRQNRWRYTQDYEQERFYEVIMPRLQGELGEDVRSIARQRIAEEVRWNRIETTLTDYYKQVQQWEQEENKEALKDYEEMMEDIRLALNDYDLQQRLEDSQTTIHKFALNNGMLSYEAKGEVNGRLLNQFSMNEHEAHLQVATTVQLFTSENVQYNNVFILDENMNTVGELENIAPDERIYSVRFMGDTAYMVTFKEVDPFFVIDLSDASNPKVLGELKLPGYSDYLHPIENNLVIGIGHETTTASWGGVQNAGVKIALFDASNPTEPTLVDDIVLGKKGSSTPVSNDHKAFRYLNGNIILPVLEVTEGVTNNKRRDVAYVIEVDEQGLDIISEIEHASTKKEFYSWREGSAVLRSTYIGDMLYTLSAKFIKANDMADDFTEVASITLPQVQERNYWW